MASTSVPTSQGYTVGQILGAGAFGTVYKARNPSYAICALKHIDISAGDSSDWKREVSALSQVSGHENVVEMRKYFVVRNELWIEMEFCNGGTLNDYIIKKNPNNAIKYQLMVEMSSGVVFLHSRCVTHRDLKPDNIMINIDSSGNHHAKVADFGLAKVLADKNCGGSLPTFYMKTTCGTPYFMAPEVYDHYTEKADVFSLGVIFRTMAPVVRSVTEGGKKYLAITYGGRTFAEWMIQNRKGIKFPQDMSNRMIQLLNTMISYDYHDRPSAQAVSDTLQSILPSELSK